MTNRQFSNRLLNSFNSASLNIMIMDKNFTNWCEGYCLNFAKQLDRGSPDPSTFGKVILLTQSGETQRLQSILSLEALLPTTASLLYSLCWPVCADIWKMAAGTTAAAAKPFVTLHHCSGTAVCHDSAVSFLPFSDLVRLSKKNNIIFIGKPLQSFK